MARSWKRAGLQTGGNCVRSGARAALILANGERYRCRWWRSEAVLCTRDDDTHVLQSQRSREAGKTFGWKEAWSEAARVTVPYITTTTTYSYTVSIRKPRKSTWVSFTVSESTRVIAED